jgi:formylglycine-generating enzyme required for sulfatase activity
MSAPEGMGFIPGALFLMGGDDEDAHPEDGEGPVREVMLRPFLIDRIAVTNAQFAAFVADASYVTEAERYGWSFVFHLALQRDHPGQLLVGVAPGARWWVAVEGATWWKPEGPGSRLAGREDHPVVHVSWNDAAAYAAWAGKRLPTEAEWECAARGGRTQTRFPWGDELTLNRQHRCNIWQGTFPFHNTAEDGFACTAPADAFPPNDYGLHNVCGNVWEWCADWWSPDWHMTPSDATRTNPCGPAGGDGKVIRGGSYLCHSSYCRRYRLSARTFSATNITAGHTGFRCAKDP